MRLKELTTPTVAKIVKRMPKGANISSESTPGIPRLSSQTLNTKIAIKLEIADATNLALGDMSYPKSSASPTVHAVIAENADFGVAFDGDFDRCFFFDHLGNFIPSEYVVGLLAEVFLMKEKGATIIHDPRVIWNTIDVIGKCGGQAVVSKTGHTFLKAAMRASDAIYGGEMSAHHYFRDFAYCDSGIIPWLLVWEYLSISNLLLSDLILAQKNRFPSSGELNFKVPNTAKCMERVQQYFTSNAVSIDLLDGLSMTFDTWRFNLRKSNTEPLVRLNLETRGDRVLLQKKTNELKLLIKQL